MRDESAIDLINLETWDRRETFKGFLDFDFPYMIVGAELEVTQALNHFKQHSLSPYLCLIYAMCKVANQIPAFRQRIRQGKPIEHSRIHANFTTPRGENSFAIKLAPFHPDFKTFYSSVRNVEALPEVVPGNVDATHAAVDDAWLFMSCVPWVSFTHVVQPTTRESGSIPRIVWGKFKDGLGNQKLLPVSLQAHHSLVDGIHVGKFYQQMQALLSTPEQTFK